MATILIVDDKDMMRDSLSLALARGGHKAVTTGDPTEAPTLVRQHRPACVITDLKMPKMDGIELLQKIRAEQPDTPVVLMTAFATISTAVQAMRLGAFDYVQKPFESDEIMVVVERAIEHGKLVADNQAFRANAEAAPPKVLIGESKVMQEIKARIAQVAASPAATALISGESGTGKENVAQIIHSQSARNARPMVCLNCAALPASLLESELFGHEKGAFTGADKLRKGRFELADGSTLLLDEISEIDLGIQSKLLRVLQERAFERVGGSVTQQVDVRVIATTNRNLVDWVKHGKFREDLFYRLNVVPIPLPPLRERTEDVPALCEHFLSRIAARDGRPKRHFEPRAMETLQKYHWPGNVRELENICERSVVLESGEAIRASTISPWIATIGINEDAIANTLQGVGVLEELERRTIMKVLEKHNGHRMRTAKELGIGLRTLGMKLKKLKEEGALNEA
ncbi:MAG: sigma-54 dependent transcriptional regulator [Phycisphaerales bacterium]|nr:sigma-54 dependent transcriptional regulator [Phycisphaerales bacterium]